MKKDSIILALASLMVLLFISCENSNSKLTTDKEEAKVIAEEAYIFAYPMLLNHQIMYMQALNTEGAKYQQPFNKFSHIRELLTADFTDIVGPNNNTLYSLSWLDLRSDPQVLTVPPIADERFYVLQIIDMFTHNFAYVGARTSGWDGGKYLIAGPNWKGDKPEGITEVFRSEGDFVYALGRTYVPSAEDLQTAQHIQSQYQLQSLSEFAGGSDLAASNEDIPDYNVSTEQDASFISTLNFLLAHVQAHPSEKSLYERFAKIGIEAGKSFDINSLSPDMRQAIDEGVSEGIKKIASQLTEIGEQVNGWNNFGAGFGNRELMQGRYLDRAAAAMSGIYGNNPKENNTYLCMFDSDNESLDGSKNNYVIHFTKDQIPPVKGFWSITMYDAKKILMVPNPINRFSIWGDDTELIYGEDGSLTIHFQKDEPKDKNTNWLPAPDEEFGLALRVYWPEEAILNGAWTPSAVKKAN